MSTAVLYVSAKAIIIKIYLKFYHLYALDQSMLTLHDMYCSDRFTLPGVYTAYKIISNIK